MDKRTLDFGDCTEVGGQKYALNLYTLAESIKAITVLEIGAGWGWSARAFALSLGTRGGRLISIDPHPERIKPENRGRVDAALGHPWEVRKERSGDKPFNERIDLLYIDGDPRNAESDFRTYYENVRPGGYIVVDGYGGQPGPTEFVDAVQQIGPLVSRHHFLTLQYNDVYCHAVHRKSIKLNDHDKYEARCTQCGDIFSSGKWSGLETLVDAHVAGNFHNVEVLVGSRRLKYMKGPR